jgi:hypothetical protein
MGLSSLLGVLALSTNRTAGLGPGDSWLCAIGCVPSPLLGGTLGAGADRTSLLVALAAHWLEQQRQSPHPSGGTTELSSLRVLGRVADGGLASCQLEIAA